MTPGEIYLVAFPNFDEEARDDIGARPVALLAVGPRGWDEDEVVVIAPITGRPSRVQSPYRGDVVIHEWQACGLHRLSVARCRQFAGVPPAVLEEYLGTLDEPTFDQMIVQARSVGL